MRLRTYLSKFFLFFSFFVATDRETKNVLQSADKAAEESKNAVDDEKTEDGKNLSAISALQLFAI